MHLDLNSFAAQCHTILKCDSGPKGRSEIAALLRQVLQDPETVKTYLNPNTPERELLYEDPELGFCIVAHRYLGAKESEPHDHAHSWEFMAKQKAKPKCMITPCLRKRMVTLCGKSK